MAGLVNKITLVSIFSFLLMACGGSDKTAQSAKIVTGQEDSSEIEAFAKKGDDNSLQVYDFTKKSATGEDSGSLFGSFGKKNPEKDKNSDIDNQKDTDQSNASSEDKSDNKPASPAQPSKPVAQPSKPIVKPAAKPATTKRPTVTVDQYDGNQDTLRVRINWNVEGRTVATVSYGTCTNNFNIEVSILIHGAKSLTHKNKAICSNGEFSFSHNFVFDTNQVFVIESEATAISSGRFVGSYTTAEILP